MAVWACRAVGGGRPQPPARIRGHGPRAMGASALRPPGRDGSAWGAELRTRGLESRAEVTGKGGVFRSPTTYFPAELQK